MSQRYSTLDQITPANVKRSGTAVGLPGAIAREVRGHAAGGRWRHVHRAGAERCGGDRRADRARVSGFIPTRRRRTRAPAAAVSIAGSRFSATRFHGHYRRASARDRRQEAASRCGTSRSPTPAAGYAITHAPLVVKDKVIVGTAGGEYGIRGFIAAYDATTGKEVWRFYTIPGPGEPGNETWAGDSWKTGGGSVWMTGSYDPASEPDLLGHRQSRARTGTATHAPGDNLYSDSRGGARCRHRQAEMVLPVLAARRVRLRFRAGSRAGGHAMARARRARS